MPAEVCMSLEETNAIRKQLGLKLIEFEETGSKVENVQGTSDKKNDNAFFMDKEKIGQLRKRLARFNRNIIDQEIQPLAKDGPDDDWLNRVGKKRQRQVTVVHEEEPEENLPLLHLSHSVHELTAGKDVILTLKESSLNGDDEAVLEDAHLTESKRDSKNLRLKKLNKERKNNKINLEVSSLDIEQDEDSDDDSSKSVLIIGGKTNSVKTGQKSETPVAEARQDQIKVQFEDGACESYEGDFQPVKIKKRKIRDVKSRTKSPSDIRPVQLVDEDLGMEENLLITKMSRPLLTNNTHDPGAIISQIRRENFEKQERTTNIAHLNKNTNLVINENMGFLDSLRVNTVTMEMPRDVSQKPDNAADGHIGQPARSTPQSEVESPDFSKGLASTLQFLREREVPTPAGAEDEQTSGNDKRYQEYNPEINLIYRDEKGNQLTTKEAYKKLSQKFHGTKSNKKKRDKFDARVQARARLQNNDVELS
ncbi:SNU66 (YOR308C) [Zygosaccharomyces parabailii]|nr:SNU66 (YOR308C) [Zygosaccharomyces parabailii]